LKIYDENPSKSFVYLSSSKPLILIKENQTTLKLKKDIHIKRFTTSCDSPVLKSLLENINPRKRPREVESESRLELSAKKATPRAPLVPTATPNKLGIHRMIIKNKRENTNRSIESKKKSKKNRKSKKKRTVKLNLGPKKKSEAGGKKITFECDNCKETFGSYKELNEHLESHEFEEPFSCQLCDATFANEEYRKVHIKARHETKDTEAPVEPIGAFKRRRKQ
jgi:DNA-directed RNA polymerase subunit M/transcription elongation factor TFIIS